MRVLLHAEQLAPQRIRNDLFVCETVSDLLRRLDPLSRRRRLNLGNRVEDIGVDPADPGCCGNCGEDLSGAPVVGQLLHSVGVLHVDETPGRR